MKIESDDVFSREGLQKTVSRQPVWRWVLQWVLIPLFLLDVASRRLASTLAMSVYVELAAMACLFGLLYAADAPWWGYLGGLLLADCIGWSVRSAFIMPALRLFTAPTRALARVGERGSASVSQLRGVRDKVREDMGRTPTTQDEPERRRPPSVIPLEPLADARRRFDIGDKADEKPAGDLTESLGGAAATESTEETTSARKKRGADEKQGDLTSRLLKAKRRARDQMKDDDAQS